MYVYGVTIVSHTIFIHFKSFIFWNTISRQNKFSQKFMKGWLRKIELLRDFGPLEYLIQACPYSYKDSLNFKISTEFNRNESVFCWSVRKFTDKDSPIRKYNVETEKTIKTLWDN